MARKTVAVYDGSEGYINRFLEYLSGKTNLWFETAGFHDAAALESYLAENKVDVLLFSMEELVEETEDKEERYEKFIAHENVKEVVYFGERRNSRSRLRHISKYQSMESILSELREIVFSKEEQKALREGEERKKTAELVGIYAPAMDGTLVAVALKLAEALSVKRQVLLIDLERFSMIPYMAGIREDNHLSDLIYFYQTSPARLPFCLEERRARFHNIDILSAPSEMEDMEAIPESGWPEFLQKLAECGNYETIVVSMAEAFRSLESMFDACDRIYIPASAGDAESYKVSKFTKQLTEKGRRDLFEKIHFLSVDGEKDAESGSRGETGWNWQKNSEPGW